MRCVLRAVVLALALLTGLCASAGAQQPRSVSLHLRWRLNTSDVAYTAATDRYVAIIQNGGTAPVTPVTLLDEQRETRQTLTPPGCPKPVLPLLGGGFLLVECHYPGGPYAVFDIAASQWNNLVASCPSGSICQPAGIGRDWLKLSVVESGCIEHCYESYLLQDLRTNAVREDPASPGGRVYDELDAPTGSAPLCSPLRYPRVATNADPGWGPGQLQFEGPFVLTTGTKYTGRDGLTADFRLRRCGSALNLEIAAYPPVFISSRAVIWESRSAYPARLAGRYLPGLTRFTANGAPQSKNPYLPWQPAALTRRTIYMYGAGGLWAASLPSPPRR